MTKASKRTRDGLLVSTALIGTALALLPSCSSSQQRRAPDTDRNTEDKTTKAHKLEMQASGSPIEVRPTSGSPNEIRFPKGAMSLAGHLYVPDGFDPTTKYPAIVVVHPAGGVKEQTSGLYAQRLAEEGFVTLAFDASHQGDSGGEPRYLEDPGARVEDIRSAVDYLSTLGFVDTNRIGGLGICAGSGYTVKAVSTDQRIKAVATVSAFDMGEGFRKGWEGKASVSEQLATLKAVGEQRLAEARGAAPIYINYVPETIDDKTHPDMREAHEYYRTPSGRTPRGHMHPRSENKMLFTSLDKIFAFSGFDQVDTLLTQPLLVIAGSKAGSLWHSQKLYEKKATGEKEFFVIEGATHMDLYAGEHVGQAMTKLSPFFKSNLGASAENTQTAAAGR